MSALVDQEIAAQSRRAESAPCQCSSDYGQIYDTGGCEWAVRGYYGARMCGRRADTEIANVRVCWQHEDILVRAGVEAISTARLNRSSVHAVERAISEFLTQGRGGALDGDAPAARRLGELIGQIVRDAEQAGVDLGIGVSLDDIVEERLREFAGGSQ